MVNYDKDIYYSKIDYQQKMDNTKELFIKGKYNNVDKQEFSNQAKGIWDNIDHSYMERTIQEQKQKIMDEDHITMKQQQELPDKYELNDISTFKYYEDKYANKVINSYGNLTENNTDYLTQVIKDYAKIEWVKKYSNGSKHNVAEYLSMLYNVNLRMASWNQTIKDGEILGIDLMILETHPNACETCLSHMGKLYSISGKDYNIANFGGSLEDAYNDGVGHPNCKCNFSLYWDSRQLEQPQVMELYEPVQKGRALELTIRRLSLDYDLYKYIGNNSEADKTMDKINKLQGQLDELLILYDIYAYIF